MESRELERALEVARAIADEVGTILMRGWRGGAEVRKKGVIDLVTDYDLESERLIRRRLTEAFPQHRLVAEEGEAGDVAPASDELAWFVDPLDGTTNFAHGHSFFCVSLALYRGDAPLVGVVAAPALETTWHAARGLGARRNDVPCRVSDTTELENALCATGFPYDKWTNPDNNVREFEAFLLRSQGVRRCGSAAIDLALVADGTYDIYWEQRLSPWDMCGGAVLVLEAGGRLSDYRGGRADPRSGSLVATNGTLHEHAVAIVSTARAG